VEAKQLAVKKQRKKIFFLFLYYYFILGAQIMVKNNTFDLIQDIKFRLMTSGIENEQLAEQIARDWATRK